ncbi:MAG: ArnT family glycosyltransferase [Candidatus Acidiferrales bacterium]
MSSQILLSPPPVAGASSHPLPALHFDPERRSGLSAAGHFFASYGWALLIILAFAWYLRARDPNYSSAFMDESIYIVYGRMFLTGHFEAPLDHPLHFSFGWYLWPVLAATADRIGGLAGVRELAAALSVITVSAVFGFARRLFSPAVGLASAAIFAFLGPAVLASRIATRDAGAITFFALGLWAYVRAWQEEENRVWVVSSLCFFAAFLCKYLVAIYFPFLVLLALRKGKHAGLRFAFPLSLSCAGYGLWHFRDLAALLTYARAYGSLKAPAAEAWKIYFTERLDFWILLLLSLAAWKSLRGTSRRSISLLWLGAAILPLFQLYSRADYDYWKHVNYSFLFLVPVAMQGLLYVLRRMSGSFSAVASSGAVAALALALGWHGDAWKTDRAVFWPNVEPIVAYLDGRLSAESAVLTDDTVLRYYLHPALRQWKITDQYYFHYQNLTGEPAYSSAVRDGYFSYIALDGGMDGSARRLRAVIQPELPAHYELRLNMPDPNLHQDIAIYERFDLVNAAPSATSPQIEILSPATQSVVKTTATTTSVQGVSRGARPGSFVLLDVFTNRWYPQGGKIVPAISNGAFSGTIELGGQGGQQCHHLVRAQLFDDFGRRQAVALLHGIARANLDGSAPVCR